MQVICKNKLLMEIDICFHNLKQRFNSSEGFYYSSYTKTSFWFLWPASDALLQSIKSRILPALSWMHHVCSASQSRCSKRRNKQHFALFSLGRCFFSGNASQMMRSPQSLYWQITGLVSTLWFLHSCWLISYLSLCIIFQTIRFNRDYQGIVTLLLNYHGHDHLLILFLLLFFFSLLLLFLT